MNQVIGIVAETLGAEVIWKTLLFYQLQSLLNRLPAASKVTNS